MSKNVVSLVERLRNQSSEEARAQLADINVPERLINPIIKAGSLAARQMGLAPHMSPLAPYNIVSQDFASIWDFAIEGNKRLFSLAAGDYAIQAYLQAYHLQLNEAQGASITVRTADPKSESMKELILNEFESWLLAVGKTNDISAVDCTVQLISAIYIAGFLQSQALKTEVHYAAGSPVAPMYLFKFCEDDADVVEKSRNCSIAIILYPDTVVTTSPTISEDA